MDPVVVFIIAAAIVVIIVLVHRRNRHHHRGHGHHVLGSAGSLGATQSSSPYTGDCLTNYLANKKLYGNDIATTVAKGCMLYSNPTADPCGCAPAFADSIQGGSSIQSAAKVLKQCMEHNDYDCTSWSPLPTPAPFPVPCYGELCPQSQLGSIIPTPAPQCNSYAWVCTN
jgi:hypothetical protein